MKPSEIAKILYNENGIIRDVPNVKPAPVVKEGLTKKTGDNLDTGEFKTTGAVVWDNPKWIIVKRSHPKFKSEPYALIDREKGRVHAENSVMQALMAKSKEIEEQYISNHNKSYVALNQRER